MMSFSSCVRQELASLGVRVALVEPGFFKTELLARAAANGGGGAKEIVAGKTEHVYPSFKAKMEATEGMVQASEEINDALCGGLGGVESYLLCC